MTYLKKDYHMQIISCCALSFTVTFGSLQLYNTNDLIQNIYNKTSVSE